MLKNDYILLPMLKNQTLASHVFRSNSELFEDPWEVVFDDISLHRIIGEGAFGKVYSGRLFKQIMEVGKGRKPLQRKTDKGAAANEDGPHRCCKNVTKYDLVMSEFYNL